MFKRRVSLLATYFFMLGGGIPGKWAFLDQFISMAVPTGYQHQNRGEILIFLFQKYFWGHSDVRRVRFRPVFGTFLVRFWYTCPHAVPRKFSPVFGA